MLLNVDICGYDGGWCVDSYDTSLSEGVRNLFHMDHGGMNKKSYSCSQCSIRHFEV